MGDYLRLILVNHVNAISSSPDYNINETLIKKLFIGRPWSQNIYLKHQSIDTFWRKTIQLN